jgi:hypothetical protein
MLDVVRIHWLFAPSWHEDLDGFVFIAVGALIERTLCATPRSSNSLPWAPRRYSHVSRLARNAQHSPPERERRAKIINAEGEEQAAQKLVDAARRASRLLDG